jgi:pyruvate kinase
MVARGDLAVEISSPRLPVVQRMLVTKAVHARKPVIVATQMLHSMIENPRPTRAEVNDIATAIAEGTDAIMLSGETAYGQYPVEAVQMMTSIAHEIEAHLPKMKDLPNRIISNQTASYLMRSAVEASVELPIRAIVADTTSGNTVRGMAAYRGQKLIYAHCYKESTMRALALSFGVYADHAELPKVHAQFVVQALDNLLKRGYKHSEQVLIISGSFGKANGSSFIEVGEIEQLKELAEHHSSMVAN